MGTSICFSGSILGNVRSTDSTSPKKKANRDWSNGGYCDISYFHNFCHNTDLRRTQSEVEFKL